MKTTWTGIMNSLPASDDKVWYDEVRQAVSQKTDAIIVLDDDPTGTQTSYDIPVLTDWKRESIEQELKNGSRLFFILTNSRSFPEEKAVEMGREMGENIRLASEHLSKKCMVISRSDSTLRGHYPSEVNALEKGMGMNGGIHIIIPAFFEGGRVTIHDTHFVRDGESLIPAAETPFARDKVFGFRHSDMKKWVEEKTNGKVPAAEVVSFSIEELRSGNTLKISQKLNACKPGSVCVVNAAEYADLHAFTVGLMQSEITPVCRTAASYVAALAGVPPRPLLTREEMVADNQHGGILVAGSYVPKTTQQLNYLFEHSDIHRIELDVAELLDHPDVNAFCREVSKEISDRIIRGEDLVVYTSRELITGNSSEENLSIGRKISHALTTIIGNLDVHPGYLIAKGGITSSDVATISLGIRRAMIMGQAMAGVPVWKTGAESKYPWMSYIIFPGNVGDEKALYDLTNILSTN